MCSTLPRLLENARLNHSLRIAVEDSRTNATLTYAELGHRADAVCDVLRACGVVPGDRVGVCAPKSASVVAAIHGILSAGAAYVPADYSAPAARTAGIFNDCSVKAVIVDAAMCSAVAAALHDQSLEDVAHFEDDLIVLGRRQGGEAASMTPGRAITGSDIAYILYTSGSTGKPKGVVHTHASALGFIDWCAAMFEPAHTDRFSSHAPFHFDLSILDLFLPVTCGAAVVLIREDSGKQPLTLAQIIEERALTVWYSTPSTLRLLTGYGRLDRRNHSSLRLVLFAGEVFPAGPLNALRAHWPAPRFFNLYGPTETNVCTFFELPQSLDASRTTPYPIGHACDGDLARVLDADGRDVEPGTEGELCISGRTVMQGYWNLDERTSHSFVEDEQRRRWYRTGDIVTQSAADGFLFLGRRDRMVKRRGYRVELAEIEAALSAHPDIEDAVVTAAPDAESGVRLDATLVIPGNSRPSIVALKQYCSRNLPAYMIPDRFLFRDSIPQTSTGKVDYQILQEETR